MEKLRSRLSPLKIKQEFVWHIGTLARLSLFLDLFFTQSYVLLFISFFGLNIYCLLFLNRREAFLMLMSFH